MKNNKSVLHNNQYKKSFYNNKIKPFKYGGEKTSHDFDNIIDEEDLSCFLHDNEVVYNFAFKIMYYTIKKLKEIGVNESEIIGYIVEKIDTVKRTTYIQKPGFTNNDATPIYNLIIYSNNEEDAYNDFIYHFSSDKFHQLMGSFSDIMTDKNIIFSLVDHNKELKDSIITRIRELFSLPKINHTTDDNKIWEITETHKGILLDTLMYGSVCPKSLYRRNMNNFQYIRTRIPKQEQIISSAIPASCHKSIINNDNKSIIKSDSYYSIDNSIFKNLLELYKRKYLSGPSSSAVLAHNFCFTLLAIEKTKENQLLLLSCIIADYIPYFHSLTEILMTYTFEINEHYDISLDPVDTAKKLIKSVLGLKSIEPQNRTLLGRFMYSIRKTFNKPITNPRTISTTTGGKNKIKKKLSIYKEIFGKQMKIYKMPDSRKEYVKYKGDLLLVKDYKNLIKQKASAKTKAKK